MANDFEKAYAEYKAEKKIEKVEPSNDDTKKKSIPIWARILIFMFAASATKLLVREYGFGPGILIVLFTIMGIAGIIYFYRYAKKNHLVSKIKEYKRIPNPDELLKWHDLKEKGVITVEEFEVHKKRILG